jgi:hypothetical protein
MFVNLIALMMAVSLLCFEPRTVMLQTEFELTSYGRRPRLPFSRLMPEQLHPPRTARRQKRAATISNSWIGGGNSYGSVRSEDLLGRLPCDYQAAGKLGGECRESADERRESPAVQRWEGYR